MAGPNCLANVPINHQYALIPYGDVNTDPYLMRFAAVNFGLRRQVQTVKDEGTGVPFDVIGTEIETRYPVSGTVSMIPRPDQMQYILPCLLGNTPSPATVYQPAGVICDFFHLGHWDPTVGQLFKYQDLVTNTWRITASDSSPLLSLEWEIEGATRATAVAAVAPFTLPLSIIQPWVFRQATVTLGATTFRVKDVEIMGNNNLSTEDFYNSAYRVELPTQKQDYMLKVTIPFDTVADFNLLQTSTNIVGQVVFTSGANILTFDFPSLFTRPEDPNIQGKERIHLPIELHAQYNPAVVGETPIKITNVP